VNRESIEHDGPRPFLKTLPAWLKRAINKERIGDRETGQHIASYGPRDSWGELELQYKKKGRRPEKPEEGDISQTIRGKRLDARTAMHTHTKKTQQQTRRATEKGVRPRLLGQQLTTK